MQEIPIELELERIFGKKGQSSFTDEENVKTLPCVAFSIIKKIERHKDSCFTYNLIITQDEFLIMSNEFNFVSNLIDSILDNDLKYQYKEELDKLVVFGRSIQDYVIYATTQ